MGGALVRPRGDLVSGSSLKLHQLLYQDQGWNFMPGGKKSMEKMMSICLTWFPISVLGEPNIYHDSGVFYKNVGILLGGCLTVKN